MRKKFQKWMALALGVFFLTSCTPTKTDSSNSQQVEGNLYNFEQIYRGGKSYTLEHNEEVEISLSCDIGKKNYLKIDLYTNMNLVGYIYYEHHTDATTNNKEKIYIEKGATEFATFLDAYRVGAKAPYKKKLTKIVLQNVEKETGQVLINSVEISDRTYDRTEELYIDDGSLKMGTALLHGGAIRHIEKLNAGVVEYIDQNGNVCINPNVDSDGVELISEEVNLVNIHDLGREIQQSYYSLAGKENGYDPTEEVWYDGTLRYNPVQAGSAGDKESQIIDYEVTDGEIYVKVKPLEWFFHNTLSDSYMENRYYFNGKGVLIAYNRFVNFSQFTNLENVAIASQEMPAVYIAQPLNYFYCETVDGNIKDSNLSPLPTSDAKHGLFDGKTSNYHYSLDEKKVPGDWLAFVNEQSFGLGMYMPQADYYAASRGVTSTSYERLENHISASWQGNGKYIPSAYVTNYNYFTSGIFANMLDFVPIEYEYAVYVGTVWDMREEFSSLQERNVIDNAGLTAWQKG